MAAAFLSPLVLRLLADASGRPVLSDSGRCQWAHAAPHRYRDAAGHLITVPGLPDGLSDADVLGLWRAGGIVITDLASIPRLAWDELPPDGPWARAADLHDFLYATRGKGVVAGQCWITKPGGYSRAEADDLLDEAMALSGVEEARRVVIFEAVRAGGWTGWGS